MDAEANPPSSEAAPAQAEEAPGSRPSTPPAPDVAAEPSPSRPQTPPLAQDSSAPLAPSTPSLPTSDKGVGSVMVDGYPEALEKQAAEVKDDADMVETQPKALDEEVAKEVAKEEGKAVLPLTPSPPPRSLSPLPVEEEKKEEQREEEAERKFEAQSETKSEPSAPVEKDAKVQEDQQIAPPSPQSPADKKRPLPPSPAPPAKKSRTTDEVPIAFSHAIHPPTSTLFISNLKRPFMHSALHEYLFPLLLNRARLLSHLLAHLLPATNTPVFGSLASRTTHSLSTLLSRMHLLPLNVSIMSNGLKIPAQRSPLSLSPTTSCLRSCKRKSRHGPTGDKS